MAQKQNVFGNPQSPREGYPLPSWAEMPGPQREKPQKQAYACPLPPALFVMMTPSSIRAYVYTKSQLPGLAERERVAPEPAANPLGDGREHDASPAFGYWPFLY
jgi:hypothetical protein